ncbi:hypothetical protein [Shewanella maritima]|uniref:hypothetical protein n=1 Tax=Shewanella maritima TaxID=2520507 RepID=UPI003735E0A5
MRDSRLSLISIALLLVVGGCNSTQTSNSATDIRPITQVEPAVLVKPNTLVQQELQLAVNQLLSSKQVTLAKNAFTQSSQITLERQSFSDANGHKVMGRTMEMPEQFQLLKQGHQCIVRHLNTNEQVVLQHATCKSEASR